MAPTPPTVAKTTKPKPKQPKEKIFHPLSRKAGQLERKQLRSAKLSVAASKKVKRERAIVDKFAFFLHAIPPEAPVVSLEELHTIIREIWLKRHDAELEKERAARRKGRPKTSKQMQLEEMVVRETEEYRTGLEVPDITHAPTVKIFRQWGQTGVGFLDLLRYIRISSENPSSVVVSRPGKHDSITNIPDVEMADETTSP
ncbi:hypothetical protein M422DRAFT_23933 [Sphaerobolus stellatus SS14]|nr:hypothetical protein M422DRAFT_23933 [Sphaerobolus stellatus SS14]